MGLHFPPVYTQTFNVSTYAVYAETGNNRKVDIFLFVI